MRVNAAGSNLNREWLEPSLDKSPEVYLVKRRMEEVRLPLYGFGGERNGGYDSPLLREHE